MVFTVSLWMSEEEEILKIMPKLIIPNAYELYQSGDATLTQEEINARYFYNLRFLWLLESGDAIILPRPPAAGFLSYLAMLKQIDMDSLHIVVLGDDHVSLSSASLLDNELIMKLRGIVTSPVEWSIQSCCYTREVLWLAEALDIEVTPAWKKLIISDFIRLVNSKVEFRKISTNYCIPIPEGNVCYSQDELAESIKSFLLTTGQVIIKQEFNAAGKGNIGVGKHESNHFSGVIKTIILNDKLSICEAAKQIWRDYSNAINNLLIVEVYYPNQGSFTAQYWVPPSGQEPALLNYSEILMEERWVGVQMPPRSLPSGQTNALIAHSRQFALIMQSHGYHGYLCCDAILTYDDRLLFTEINVRPGAETHAYLLARQLFGVGHENKMTVITRNGLKIDSFLATKQQLLEKNILLKNGQCNGIVLLTVDDVYSKQSEYLIAAPNLASAQLLESGLIE